MKNPGIFISAPANSNPANLAKLRRDLSKLAVECGYPARRGKRGSIYRLLAAMARGEITLKIKRKSPRRDSII